MRALLTPVLLLLLASPGGAQPLCAIEATADSLTAECGRGGYGVRWTREGVFELAPGAARRNWRARRLPPFPAERDPVSVTSADRTGGTVVPSGTSAVHRVLVAYTPRAESASGGPDNMYSLIVAAIAAANLTYANSQVPLRLDLADVVKVAYTETDLSTDLGRFRAPGDGFMDEVHVRRDASKADLLSLFGTGYVSQGYCGLGYFMFTPSTSFAGSAFNVVDRTCAVGNLSFPHEIGHTQGLHHDPPNAGTIVAGTYHYGHRVSGLFRTLMSYGGEPRIKYLSSPLVTYNGTPTGTADRDNARRLRETMGTVEAFRTGEPTAPAPPPAPVQTSEWSTPQTVFATTNGLIGFGDDGENAVYALSGRKFRRSLDEGATWEPEISLPGTLVEPFLERPLAGLGSVVAIVAKDIHNWSADWLGTRPNGALALYVSTNRGASFVGPLRATPTTERALRWSVAVGPDGRVHWVWMHDSGDSWQVKYASYANGAVSAPVVLADGVGPVGAERPSLAINGTTLAVTWLDGRDNIGVGCTYEGNKPIPDCPEVYVRRSLDGGATWQTPVRLTFDATTYSGRPLIVGDGASTFAIFYDKRPQGGENSLWQFRSTDNGATWADSLVSDESGDENHASAVLRGTDGLSAWLRGSTYSRAGRSFDTGATWGGVEGLSSAVATPMVAATTNYLHVYTMTGSGQLQVRRKARSGGGAPPSPPPPPDPCVADPLVLVSTPVQLWPVGVTAITVTQVGRSCPPLTVNR